VAEIPVEAIEQFEAYCATAVAQDARDEIRVEATTSGTSLTIWEVRAPWGGDPGPEWERSPCAQCRYNPVDQKWTAFWPNRDEEWLPYPQMRPTTSVARVIEELERDPYCCFWG
jgi:hypothetical protein